MKKYLLLASILILPFIACSLRTKTDLNQKKIGHFELYSHPKPLATQPIEGHKKVFIAMTTELSGNLSSYTNKIIDAKNQEVIEMKIGGEKVMSRYFEILRQKTNNHLLLIDSGNFLNPKKQNYNEMLSFFETNKYDAVGIGEYELLASLEDKGAALEEIFDKRKTSYLAGNIFDLRKAQKANFKNTSTYLIKTINGIRVGIFQAISPEKVSEAYTQKNQFYIQPLFESILKTTQILRSKNVDMIVAVIHAPIDCTSLLAQIHNLPETKVNFDPDSKEICNHQDEIYKILNTLPDGTLDLVIASGKDSKAANIIAGTPVIKTLGDGHSFSMVEFNFDEKTKKVNQAETHIYQPIKFCEEFIADTKDCFVEGSERGIKIIPASFLGEEINVSK